MRLNSIQDFCLQTCSITPSMKDLHSKIVWNTCKRIMDGAMGQFCKTIFGVEKIPIATPPTPLCIEAH